MMSQYNECRTTTFGLTLVLISISILYFPVMQGLLSAWNSNDNYSHGYFIPFIAGYMIWHQYKKLKGTQCHPSLLGLVVVVIGLFELLLGYIGAEFFLQRTSLIIVISGSIIYLYGFQYFRVLLVPIAYLIFMIPLPAIIWNQVAFPLQIFSSCIAEYAVNMMGFSVFRQGNVLFLPTTTLEVVDACSGLRSLMTMFALSSVLAWQAKFSNMRKMILFLAAAPIAIFSNVIRLAATVILAWFYGSEVAQGFLHEFSGFVTFSVGMIMLLAVHYLLRLSFFHRGKECYSS